MPQLVIDARNAAIGHELDVRRILPFRQKRMVGPFIFMDHAGPVTNIPHPISNMDVLPHPHIGLSTVSYLLGGKVTHRDSLGIQQEIRPGEVNWMTAGSGIAHSERFEDPAVLANSQLEMIQTWVALPTEFEETAPDFANYSPEQLPTYTDKGLWMRLIAGNAYGLKNDVKTHSPLFYMHTVAQPGTYIPLPAGHTERAIYIVRGTLQADNILFNKGQMLVWGKNDEPRITAVTECVLMMLGGEPLGERFIWWNFVSSSKDRIEQAKADWKAGRILLPPNDNHEFIPLPNDNSRPTNMPPNTLS